MHDATHRPILPNITAPLALCLFLLAACLAGPAAAREPLTDEAFLRGHLIPAAVGMRMAGDAFADPRIALTFAARPKVSGFLKANNAHLEKVALIRYGEKQLTGNLYFGDDLGRAAYYGYDIRYAAQGGNRFHVGGRTISPFEPLAPRAEAYFIPAGPLSASMLKTLPHDKLLRWARQNCEQIEPYGLAKPARKYDVLCFCMDRLMDGARWDLTLNGQKGAARSDGGWHVAHLAVDMALNAPTPLTFIVTHTRGRNSLDAGAASTVALFTNTYLPPPAPQPASGIPVPDEVARILADYQAKNLPDLTAP